jgi:hypothetical protein
MAEVTPQEIQHGCPRRETVRPEPEPLAVPPKTAGNMLGFGLTRVYALMKAGELQSYVDGGARRILVDSIKQYIARRIADTQARCGRRNRRPRKTIA